MLTTIARKEAVELWRDGRFRWGAALVVALLAVALLSGWQHYRDIEASHTAATEATWQRWMSQGEKNPHSAAHYGVYAFKPVTPLSLVDQGVNSYTGVFTWLEAHNQNPFEYRPAQDAPALARFGQLTASTVLQLLVPLLIVLLGFSAITAEREAGTLRLLLSAGVKRGTLAAGKAAGLALGLGVLLVPAALVGALALLTTGSAGAGDTVAAVSPLRVALLGGSYLLYFAAILGLTLAVSAWARTARAALVTLLGLWIVNALVAPRVATDVARARAPLPAAEVFRAAIADDLRNGIDGHSPQDKRQQALRDSVLAAYGVDSLEQLPVNYAGISLQASEEYANRVYDRHYGTLARTLLAQEDLHRQLGLAAPLLAVRSASMGLAGTDVFHHEHFVRAAEEHRRLIQRILNADIVENSRFGQTYTAGPDLWARVPEFEYQPPALAAVLANEAPSLLLLAVWVLLAGVAYGLGMRRLTPE
jgi:ABC-2 type transport system permease protein